MRIAFVPRYTRAAASTRLRCYAIAEAINKYGMGEAVVAGLPDLTWSSPTATADVIVLQKAVDVKIFEAAATILSLKVYDVDDIVEQPTRRLIVRWADVVTTDTELRAASIRKWYGGPVHVIPDPIDYESGPPKVPNLAAREGVVWFGNWPNFASVREILRGFIACGERVGAISDLTPDKADLPGLELIPWTLESFPLQLRRWRRVALSHQGADQAKSENKLVAAIYQGLQPAYVCGPSYEALMSKLRGLSWYDTQQYIWNTYRAEVIARRAMEVYAG